jgi:hypothetical protein
MLRTNWRWYRHLKGAMTTGLTIRVSGRVEGEVDLSGSDWTKLFRGDVKHVEYHDWFDEQLELRCVPRGKATGRLTIRYQFH